MCGNGSVSQCVCERVVAGVSVCVKDSVCEREREYVSERERKCVYVCSCV